MQMFLDTIEIVLHSWKHEQEHHTFHLLFTDNKLIFEHMEGISNVEEIMLFLNEKVGLGARDCTSKYNWAAAEFLYVYVSRGLHAKQAGTYSAGLHC